MIVKKQKKKERAKAGEDEKQIKLVGQIEACAKCLNVKYKQMQMQIASMQIASKLYQN